MQPSTATTFRNCIKIFIIPKKFPPDNELLVEERIMNSSYRNNWRFDILHITRCSNLPGNCFSTSAFSRRNKKGLMIECNRPIKSPLIDRLPSTILLNGLLNQYENSCNNAVSINIVKYNTTTNKSMHTFLDRKICGIKKCINDHSSIKLFCSGVPVSKSLLWVLKWSNVCHRCDLKF